MAVRMNRGAASNRSARCATAFALTLLSARAASAQDGGAARALLQEIASTSGAAASWLAEGEQMSELTGRGMRIRSESRFKSAYQGPSKMHWEIATEETSFGQSHQTGTLMVCDGVDHWSYSSPGVTFYRSPVGITSCRPEMGDFSKLTENLVSAAPAGRDLIQFEGAARECELVRAEYAHPVLPPNNPAAGHSIRTLCIDPVRKLILRDRTEAGDPSDLLSVSTTTYASYQRDADLPSELFQFQVPTGYLESDGPQPDLIVENGVFRPGPQVSPPALLTKVEPSYTAEALAAGVSGIVLVSFQVSAEGQPENVKVVRGLGYGLDEQAVAAAGQWRFHPGAKDGLPVAVGPLKAAVSFRRP